jgi:hypothetical protein
VKLVIDHARDPRYAPSPGDGPRPTLRVVQGGLSRPSRLVAPAEPRGSRDVPEEPTEAIPPAVDLNEVPIFLRPIPAWVPRLW